MEINSIIFPAPIEDKKDCINKFRDELIFIPRASEYIIKTKTKQMNHIPCLFLLSKKNPETKKFLLYFHGNAEDIFNSIPNLDLLKSILPYHVISIEYPGYSIYYSDKSAERIEEDSLIVYDYLTKKLKVNPKDIAVIGRSIGSGPAVYLSAYRDPAALVLISAFNSIRETAESFLGIFKFMIADRFRNIDIIDKVTCPLLLIHGQMDTLIPFKHSIDLSKKTSGPYELILPEEMDHNDYNLYDDFIDPICSFFKRHSLMNENKGMEIIIPLELFAVPDFITKNKDLKQDDSMSKFVRGILKV